MFVSRLYDRKLAQATYILGCQATGETLIVDPNRDLAAIRAAVAAERLRITHVTETHIHADFASGARELARDTGARLYLSAEGGPDWQYAFAGESNAQLLRDGDVIEVGRLRVEVLHTPGHTPEHLSFLVTDCPASDLPVLIFTGDFVFVGDVGRPDLLEKAAKQANTMEAGARTLWASLTRFRALPDYVQVWPGHGAGSACGKALGAVPTSTVGYEKLVNWGVAAPDEATFVRGVLEGQPEPPAYFARMKRINRDGPPLLGARPAPARLTGAAVREILAAGGVIVDLRTADVFSKRHLDGAINVPLTQSFTTYAGSAVPYEVPIVLLTGDDTGARAAEAARDLSLIAIDDVVGFAGPSLLDELEAAASHPRLGGDTAIAQRAAGLPIVDVRNSTEWAEGHVGGARLIPFPQLLERLDEVPRDSPVLIQCQSGARSAIATSLLRRHGFDARDAGGVTAWVRHGGAVVR